MTNIVYAASNGSLIRSLEYVYDAASMITNKTLIGEGMTSTSSYKYDSLDRLVGETRTGSGSSAFSVSYNYDLAGNRTSMVTRVGSVVSTNIYTLGMGNRLASWGSNGSALYDTAGNTTNFVPSNGASFNLQWDERDRLKQFVVPSSGSSVEYGYDVQGRKISRTVNGSSAISEYYVYEGNQIVADVDASGNLLRTYTYGPGIDNILSMTIHSQTPSSPLQTFYYLKDHQNIVLALKDVFGNVVESYDYQAWGLRSVKDAFGINQTSDRGLPISALGNRYTFQGREIDWDTRLIYFRARWYNPEAGRWLSKDPIGISGGLNQYVFCGNNPVNNTDPTGLWTLQIGISASGGLAGGGQSGFGFAFGYSKKHGFQIGFYGMSGVALGTFIGAGGALTGDITWSPNDHISDLHGPAVAIGASASFGPGAGLNVGLEGTVPLSDDPCGPKTSYTLSIGGGAGTPEFHNFIGHTSVLQIIGNTK